MVCFSWKWRKFCVKVPIKVGLGSGLPVPACKWFEFYSAAAPAAQLKIFTKGILNWIALVCFLRFGKLLWVFRKNIWWNFYLWYEQSSEWKTINTVDLRDWKFEGRNHTVFSVNVGQLCKVAINMTFFIRISQVNQRKNLYCVLSKCRSVVGGCHWYEF